MKQCIKSLYESSDEKIHKRAHDFKQSYLTKLNLLRTSPL